jgi:hypothetical protein
MFHTHIEPQAHVFLFVIKLWPRNRNEMATHTYFLLYIFVASHGGNAYKLQINPFCMKSCKVTQQSRDSDDEKKNETE